MKSLKKLCFTRFKGGNLFGTVALHLVLNYLKISENDEVLLPGYTYVATANAIKYCKATQILDIEKETLEFVLINYRNTKKFLLQKAKKHLINILINKLKLLLSSMVWIFPKYLKLKICKNYNIHLFKMP